jgi:hypothetical protein
MGKGAHRADRGGPVRGGVEPHIKKSKTSNSPKKIKVCLKKIKN